MSDIAKRLRVQVDRSERWSDDYHQDESLWAIAREAADEIERLEGESVHWKSLWQGTVEYSTKIIQERDEVLREVERLEAEIECLEGMVNTMGGCLNSVAEADKLRRYR